MSCGCAVLPEHHLSFLFFFKVLWKENRGVTHSGGFTSFECGSVVSVFMERRNESSSSVGGIWSSQQPKKKKISLFCPVAGL